MTINNILSSFLAALAVGGSILVAPLFIMFLCIIFMASIGKSLGVRRFYIKLLLKVFEYGRENIESSKNQTRINFELSGSSEESLSLGGGHNSSNESITTDKDALSAGETGGEQISINDDLKINNKLQNGDVNHHNHHNHHNGHLPHSNSNSSNSLITRDALILVPEPTSDNNGGGGGGGGDVGNNKENSDDETCKNNKDTKTTEKNFEFDLSKCLDYVKSGMEAIIEDDVTSRFEAEELKNWNLLTRTNRYYEFISWRLSIIWVCGFFIRYIVLMPVRVFTCFLGVMWLTMCTALVGCMKEGETKRWMVQKVSIQCFGLLSSALSSVITFHNIENRPRGSGICVANHTSPIDVLVLMQDNCYSLIGQSHGGFLGVLQRALARASPHIWFERAESKDRHAVAQRLRQHVSDPINPPILIFPEGTCINNTSVMQFKKGSFEVGAVIYPVAIKYDPRFGDPFWNSSKYSMMQHLYLMMTSWAIVCDVWYLPPMYRGENESAIVFANRVKSVIAEQGGLIDLVWDGNLKRNKPKSEWKEMQQQEFTKRLKTE